MACDCENPCRECKGNGSECSMDPAECGHAVLPADDNLLERAFMARIRAEEFQGELAKLREEFEARPEVIGLKLSIERCEVMMLDSYREMYPVMGLKLSIERCEEEHDPRNDGW